ncbi:MAG: signal peptidase I [Clostridia bacterium]|nr:signal peptidase I [Clostridia bacterium]
MSELEEIKIESTEEKKEDKKKSEKSLPFGYDAVGVICSAVIAIMLLFTFIFRFVGVVGESMQPTLYNNDWLIVSAAKQHYEYGDIVISTQPNMFNEPIVKRVIATGGQTVKIDFVTGEVYVDGVLLHEDYIAGNTTDSLGFSGEVTVPEGKLFVMGDNREHSTDSRSDAIGLLDERYIIGKAIARVFPTDSFKIFK